MSQARQNRADSYFYVEPVRSTCVSSARAVGGHARPSLCAPQSPGCSVVGCGAAGGHIFRRRLRLRRRLREQRAQLRLRRVVCAGLHLRGARGAPVRDLHRRHPAAADPVRRRADLVLPVPRRPVHRHQGHADQLRLSADRAVPVDVLHVGRRSADRDGPLVLRHVVATGRCAVHREGDDEQQSRVLGHIQGVVAADG